MPAASPLPSIAASRLKSANHDLTPPFLLELDESLEPWRCTAILRTLPERRIVLLVNKDGKNAIAKLFFRDKDYHRELEGYQLLQTQQQPCAEILAHDDTSSFQYILFEYIDAPSLAALWQQGRDRDQRINTLCQAIPRIAELHRVGLRQMDIHLDNFLCIEDQLVLIDYASIQRDSAPLSSQLACHNFAHLIAQLAGDYSAYYPQLLSLYQQHVAISFSLQDLTTQVEQLRAKRWRHYERKIARDCSEFIAEQQFNSRLVLRRQSDSYAMRKLLQAPDAAMMQGVTLKQGNTATVSRVCIDQQSLVIKRYNIKSSLHAINRALRPTRAWASWRNAYKLRFEGLLTPLPIALSEHRFGPLRSKAYLLCEHIEGKDLWQVFNDGEDSPLPLVMLEKQVVDMFEGLLAGKLSHGDLKGTNLIATTEGLQIIDLDAMKSHSNEKKLKNALQRDLQRFLRNFNEQQRQRFEELLSTFSAKLK
ncbi:tRNA A-37 threonylcarbamoyl transferase component Bud32 [Sinobacterium caligoides]|uniref:non-specific serine/threonine protein kinase n=1 Tax=Sinobacterium caligoides TaxID=933926 RepID=A0A3N2DYX2_9GAMM|nr:RIO1 family regulatory kinase/ATPase [Sinobacterium caligoides]ROS05043.1 tRNA A-37 threonylcarbamoyl transferase component Bud32 [Sinobacterium caligoides]